MGAVTYPELAVADAISDRFVPVKIDVSKRESAPVVERFRQVWTPDFRVLGPDGFEYYRWNGYLPPFQFLPQLLVAEAQAHLRMKDFGRAAEIYGEVLTRFPESDFAAEALYYLGVAHYKQSGDRDALRESWERLQTRYPDSIWRLKQSFIEM